MNPRSSTPTYRLLMASQMILREAFARTFLVLLAVLSLFLLFDALEANNINRMRVVGYKIFALELLLEIPTRLYELLPLAVLMGTLWALSIFARNSELTVLRVSGMTVYRLLRLLAGFGLCMGLIGVIIDEVVDPIFQKNIQPLIHNIAPSHSKNNLWLRFGNQIIYAESIHDNTINGLMIIQVSPNFDRILSVTQAKTAQKNDDLVANLSLASDQVHWQMKEGWRRTFPNQDPVSMISNINLPIAATPSTTDRIDFFQESTWNDAPHPQFFVTQNAWNGRLKMTDLWPRYIFNSSNGLNNKSVAIVLWKKMFYPLMLVVMAITGLPFCLQTGRNIQTNLRLLIGIMMGITFFIIQGIFSNLGILSLPPIPSVVAPMLLFTLMTTVGLWWAQRR